MPQHSMYEPASSPYHHHGTTPFPLYHHHLHPLQLTTNPSASLPSNASSSSEIPSTPPSSSHSPPSSTESSSGCGIANGSNGSIGNSNSSVTSQPTTPSSTGAMIATGVNALLEMTPPSPTTNQDPVNLHLGPATPFTPGRNTEQSQSNDSTTEHQTTPRSSFVGSPYSPFIGSTASPGQQNQHISSMMNSSTPIPAHYHSSQPHRSFYPSKGISMNSGYSPYELN
ncbi:hypothetical protein QR98_0071960 [Sarcoptes scabiei]|uniref:Uncharacterized protein n=1 Tax=Sarcoptes scabiei TaxID=52283 RepID=A0A132ACM7_SARSC|nr:hypothetical protein QR98_0071960 [Sarcoptes scabiei]